MFVRIHGEHLAPKATAGLVTAFGQLVDFAQRRKSCKGLVFGIIDNRPHAKQAGLAADVLGWFAGKRHFADCGVHGH